MSKKKLDTSAIMNELEGASLFFAQKRTQGKEKQQPSSSPAVSKKAQKEKKETDKEIPHDITHDITISGNKVVIETIRKTVRQVGKETTPLRLTPEEKRQLADIVYTYKRHGIRTSENEINRIGINFLLADYQTHGEASILAKVVEALNA
jgi:hypothetical protein